jgi:endoglucanase
VLVPLIQLVPGNAAGRAYVRVNQVGYVQDRAKQAFLLSDIDHEGETFDLVGAGGGVVFSGTIGVDRGPWNSHFGYVNQIDFGAFSNPGVYLLRAAGATSPPFRVGTGSDLYRPLLRNALFYFLAQRDGADVDPTVLEREPSHLNDAHAKVYETPEYHNGFLVHDLVPTGDRTDVEGGWFDAGDYVKFAHTTAFVLAVMGEALRDHPELFAGDGPDFASEAKFGLDWLLRMWDGKRKLLYYQVSMGNTGLGYLSDHDVWRLPEVDDTLKGRAYRYLAHRPAFRVGPPGTLVPPSIAGRMAAAFGLCFQIFQTTDAELAGRCLRAGEGVFDIAKTEHTTNHTTAPSGYYPEGPMWRDDLELGAIELHLALRDAVSVPDGLPHPDADFYLESAAEWARAYMNQSDDMHDVFNLYDVAGLAHPELYEAIIEAGDPPLAVTADEILTNMRGQLDTATEIEESDPFGFGWYHGDPSPHTFGLVAQATWYDEVTGTDRYADLVDAEIGWSLGANAWGTTFVTGAGSRFPECPQHQVANLVGSLDGTGDVLLGGAVDGPSDYIPTGFFGPDQAPPCPPDGKNPFRPFDQADWRYVDRVASWATTEPANDYSSLAFLAFVQLAAQT